MSRACPSDRPGGKPPTAVLVSRVKPVGDPTFALGKSAEGFVSCRQTTARALRGLQVAAALTPMLSGRPLGIVYHSAQEVTQEKRGALVLRVRKAERGVRIVKKVV